MARIKIVYCDNNDKIGCCVCGDILVNGVLGVYIDIGNLTVVDDVPLIDGEVCDGPNFISKDMLSDVFFYF